VCVDPHQHKTPPPPTTTPPKKKKKTNLFFFFFCLGGGVVNRKKSMLRGREEALKESVVTQLYGHEERSNNGIQAIRSKRQNRVVQGYLTFAIVVEEKKEKSFQRQPSPQELNKKTKGGKGRKEKDGEAGKREPKGKSGSS